MIAAGMRMTDDERKQFRALISGVPEGMTPDEAMEQRMQMLRHSDERASRGMRLLVWGSALLFDVLVLAFIFCPGT